MGRSTEPQPFKVQAIAPQPRMAGYGVRVAQSALDLDRVYQLRRARFGVGEDAFDADSAQIMVEDGPQLVATFRLRAFANGAALGGSYSAQFYDLAALAGLAQPALELGRFCLAANPRSEIDVLRLAFAAMAAQVDLVGAGMLFGCASFPGADLDPHRASLGMLAAHIGQVWPIGLRAPLGIDLRHMTCAPDQASAALRGIPPLLRSYLAIGGWVGGFGVQDHDLGTIHVFTALEVAAIPAARAKALRSLAQDMALV